MTASRLNLVLFALLLAALFGPPVAVWAGQPTVAQAEAYYQLPTVPTNYRTITSGAADAQTMATPIDAQPTMGNPNWTMTGEFSTGGATATVVVGLYHTATGGFCGVSFVGTVTNATNRTNGANYVMDEFIGGGTRGAKFWDVRVINVSAGTFAIKSWAYGSEPRVAQ